jgi:hypothetical protein
MFGREYVHVHLIHKFLVLKLGEGEVKMFLISPSLLRLVVTYGVNTFKITPPHSVIADM